MTGEDLRVLWNQGCGANARQCVALSADRQKAARARLKEQPDEPYWREVIERIAASRFCQGQNDRAWRADFDFLIRPGTATKVLEGKYDNRDRWADEQPTRRLSEVCQHEPRCRDWTWHKILLERETSKK